MDRKYCVARQGRRQRRLKEVKDMIPGVVVKKECSAHTISRVDPSKASPPATNTATMRKDLLLVI
jgi:hypothetical protein